MKGKMLMITKQELVRNLKEALQLEEKSIQIYTDHISAALPWTGIGKESAEKIRKTLSVLGRDSEGHKKIVLNLIKKVEEDSRDAF